MELDKMFRLMWRWSIVSGLAIAGFWCAWYFKVGDVPEQHLTRWADILIGPIWSCSGVVIFAALNTAYEPGPWFGVAIGWFLGLVTALSIGIVSGLMVSGSIIGGVLALVLFALIVCLIVWLISRLPGVSYVVTWLSGK